ncbi:hypothetical protein ACIBSV_28395 [Embleya sp. NPDC050154]|uniref:hypothetical protein n=1 Tax=unclassified Embleya TaxID=2699296 RepID=UPI0037B0673F|nr:hypothetical protein OG948_19005 [Embleya sp. NBC_00888]
MVDMVGKRGKVTGGIGPGLVGEVMIEVRGGVEAFLAYPALPGEEHPVGSLVVIVEYLPPRTVYVAGAFG